MKITDILTESLLGEKTIINPDVSWVPTILSKVKWHKAEGDVDELADMLTRAFRKYDIAFEPAERSATQYGKGIWTDKLSKSVGIPGAEFNGEDPLMVVYITPKTASFEEVTPEIIQRISQLIKHELVHVEQNKLAKGNLGTMSDVDNDLKYYSDPQEIGAIASEMETQLLQIEPDVSKLLPMIQRGDKKLLKSARYNLYYNSAKQDPKFMPAYKKMLRAVVDRLALK